jgi:hypothetical protein
MDFPDQFAIVKIKVILAHIFLSGEKLFTHRREVLMKMRYRFNPFIEIENIKFLIR